MTTLSLFGNVNVMKIRYKGWRFQALPTDFASLFGVSVELNLWTLLCLSRSLALSSVGSKLIPHLAGGHPFQNA